MSGEGTSRRRGVALILSGVFPGLGQFYNREPIKGALFLVIGLVLSWLLGRLAPIDPLVLPRGEVGRLLVVVLVLLAIWLWSVVDAWRRAGR